MSVLAFVIFGVLQMTSFATTFTCEQCRSRCSVEKINATVKPTPSSENRTTIEDVVGANLNLIKRAMTYLSTQSCRDIPLEFAKIRNETGGVFDIFIPSKLQWVEVYCDMTTDGGNWIVFQRRMDGSVDFNRYWDDYVNGFGSANGEFWLGLELLHLLTRNGSYELRMDMTQIYSGRHLYAKYSNFKVGPASENYKLTLSGYSGTASDAMANPPISRAAILNGMQFSTRDRDNDRSPEVHCAERDEGGWWLNDCSFVNLNGPFRGGKYRSRIRWQYQGYYSGYKLRFVEMKLRQKFQDV